MVTLYTSSILLIPESALLAICNGDQEVLSGE